EPWSVYFKWLGPEAKGREVVYAKGRFGNQIHTLTAAGDVPLMPAGMQFPVSPDSPMVRSKCRYPITEAGFGGVIERFGKLVDAAERGDPREGTLRYLGPERCPEYPQPMDVVVQEIPAQCDPLMPGGGRRFWYFDPTLNLPMLIVAKD